MTDSGSDSNSSTHSAPHNATNNSAQDSVVNIAINILTSPAEAFRALEKKPSKLFPLLLIMTSMVIALFWYYSIVDFDWFIDDALGQMNNLSEEQLEAARERMGSMSPTTFKMFGMLGSTVGVLVMYVLQAGYLSMASALSGDRYRFSHWFSIIAWSNLPAVLGAIGMMVTILLSPNGQLSAYELNPLTLANLGMSSANGSVQTMINTLNLLLFWSIGLTVLAYKQWVQSSWPKTLAIVLGPYILIFGTWSYFAVF